jgi:hypothetical protein
MGLLKEYDPKQVIITWDGINLNEGIAEGTFIVVARTEKTFSLNVGGDGGVTRVKNNNKSGQAAVTIRMGSATNDKLNDRATDEEKDDPVTHVAPLLIQDFSGRTLHSSEQAFLEGFADDEFATDEGNREWVLLCPVLRPGVRGNKDA